VSRRVGIFELRAARARLTFHGKRKNQRQVTEITKKSPGQIHLTRPWIDDNVACETVPGVSSMNEAAPASADNMMQSVADAMSDASRTATDHAAKVSRAVTNAAPSVMLSMSRMAYTGAYFLAYGVVYPVVFVAMAIPRENAVMKGLHDGGNAARKALATGVA
jgi:hypothetical protein